jgi:hypothetical protein
MPRTVKIELPAAVVALAQQRAEASGLKRGETWIAQVVAAWLAGERCDHGPPLPPPPPKAEAEES